MTAVGRLTRPWHLGSPIPLWLLIGLVVLATSAMWRLVTMQTTPDMPVDFRPLYVGQLLLVEGENPYDDDLLKERWLALAERQRLHTQLLPGYPKTLLLYPPWALPLFTPFSATPWLVARALWWGSLPLLILGIVRLVTTVSHTPHRPVPFLDVLLAALAFKATDWALYVGQPMFLCLLLGFAAWRMDRSGRTVAAGVALGLAAFKVTLVVPFVLLMLYRRRWGVLAVAAVTGAVLLAVFLLINPEPAAAMASYRDNVESLRALVFSTEAEDYPVAFKMVSRTELAVLAEFLVRGAGHRAEIINLLPLAALLPFWLGPLHRRRVSPVRAFCLFAVMSLLCSHHLHYDCLVLLPMYLLATEVDRAERIALLAASAVFLVPVNGLLGLITLPPSLNILLFNVQLGLIALAAILTWGLHRTRSEIDVSIRSRSTSTSPDSG